MRAHAALWSCGAMIAGALVLVLATGSAITLLPAAACIALMLAVMYLMGIGAHNGGPNGSHPSR